MNIAKVKSEHMFKIGEKINLNQGTAEILKHTKKTTTTNGSQINTYHYRCCTCGCVTTGVAENTIINGTRCNVCSNRRVKRGINDLWTTNPSIAKLLKNRNDGYKHVKHSSSKLDWVCPICKNEIVQKSVSSVVCNGLSCPKCSDGVSYPEKIMYSILEQLNIKFQTQLSNTTFSWCENKRYDFYIHSMSCIIETHGEQHYTDKQFTSKVKLEDQENNDVYKLNIAKKNGIKNYITIDARYSNLEWIRKSIIESKMSILFDLSNIDWNKAEEYALNSRVKEVNDLWNNGYSSEKIVQTIKMSKSTVIKYLQLGEKLGWSDYTGKESKIRINNEKREKLEEEIYLKCVDLWEFKKLTVNNIAIETGLERNKIKYFLEKATKEKLINTYKVNGARKIEKSKHHFGKEHHSSISVILLNTLEIFDCMSDANKAYNIVGDGVGECCRHKQKSSGRHPITGEKLIWMRLDEFMEQNNYTTVSQIQKQIS